MSYHTASYFLLFLPVVLLAYQLFPQKKRWIVLIAASCVFYWFAFFLSRMLSGSFSDLRIWGVLACIFGAVYLLSAMKTKKETIIAAVISAVYFIIGIA